MGKEREREDMLITRARDNVCFLAFCNSVGGQDELVFDGHSVVIDDEGRVLARAPGFEEALLFVDVDPSDVVGRRLTDARRRSLARERGGAVVPVVELGGVDASPDGSRAGEVVPFDDELEQTQRALSSRCGTTSRRTGSPRW